MENHRREFLRQLAVLTASVMVPFAESCSAGGKNRDRIGEILPLRKLGKTGQDVTMLGLGGYHIGWTTEKDAQETIEAALEGGIRFFDTAESYGPHTSEERYGKYLVPEYRDLIFLMTKTYSTDARTAREHLEGSLSRLKADYLDLWQIHSVQTPEDVDTRLENGVLDVVIEAKKSGKVKHIGFTGHQNPQAHLRMLERLRDHDVLETVQMPVNPVDAAFHASFVREVIPEASARNYGILAMKTLADGRFFANKHMLDEKVWETDNPVVPGKAKVSDIFNFAWSLPISVLITGAENKSFITEKIGYAKQFVTMSASDRDKIISSLTDIAAEKKVEYYKEV